MIKPRGSPAFSVYCDMTDGGWTVFMRRYDGSQDIYLHWNHYKEGFGDMRREHWLGNDKLYYLTNQKQYRMRMDATIWSTGLKRYNVYNSFRIEDEAHNYRLHVSGYSGNTDSNYNWLYNNGSEFSTRDRDNDRWSGGSCSQDRKGAHWYNSCSYVYPTGLYNNTGTSDSMSLYDNGISYVSVKEMTLKIKSV